MRTLQWFLYLAAVSVVLGGTQARPARSAEDNDNTVKSNLKGKIEGTRWKSVKAPFKRGEIPAGALRLEFNQDGTMVYEILGSQLKGKYKLLDSDDVLIMAITIGGREEHKVRIVTGKEYKMSMTD